MILDTHLHSFPHLITAVICSDLGRLMREWLLLDDLAVSYGHALATSFPIHTDDALQRQLVDVDVSFVWVDLRATLLPFSDLAIFDVPDTSEQLLHRSEDDRELEVTTNFL
jgi:hypothetical protein